MLQNVVVGSNKCSKEAIYPSVTKVFIPIERIFFIFLQTHSNTPTR